MNIPIDKHDVWVGLFVMAGLIALVLLTLFMAGAGIMDLRSIEVSTHLERTFGLQTGVPVTYLDFEVGRVRDVRLLDRGPDQGRVEIRFTISSEFRDRITTAFHTTLEKQQFGGFLSGEIILNPPPPDQPPGRPLQDGDELEYIASRSTFDELTTFSADLKEDLLPQIQTLIGGINAFMTEINDPEGDFLLSLAALRLTSQDLARPEGDLRLLLQQARLLVAELNEEKNLLMSLLHNQEMARSFEQIVENSRAASGKLPALTDKADQLMESAKGSAATLDETLAKAGPRIEVILANLILLQEEARAFLADARKVSSSLAASSDLLPGMVEKTEEQLRELEDITRAVKNSFIIQWNLEEDGIEDPVILKPLLINRFNKKSGTADSTEEE